MEDRMDPVLITTLVSKTRKAQHLPPRVTDATTLRRIAATLYTAAGEVSRTSRPRRVDRRSHSRATAGAS